LGAGCPQSKIGTGCTFSGNLYLKVENSVSIVKRVSWFKSSLLLRIIIQHTHELQFLIKTKSSIFNWKVYTTDERKGPSMAWLEKIETGSILIKEKHKKHLYKMLDRVS
jgi:hypothetical protein